MIAFSSLMCSSTNSTRTYLKETAGIELLSYIDTYSWTTSNVRFVVMFSLSYDNYYLVVGGGGGVLLSPGLMKCLICILTQVL